MSEEKKEKKLDVRREAFRLFTYTSNWREVRQGLLDLGVKDPEAKRIAKEVNSTIRPRKPRKKQTKQVPQ